MFRDIMRITLKQPKYVLNRFPVAERRFWFGGERRRTPSHQKERRGPGAATPGW